jgi:hypothetical protein
MKNWVEEDKVFKVDLESGKQVKISSKWVYDTCDSLELDIAEALEMWLSDHDYLDNEEQDQLDTQAKASGIKVLAKEKTERKKTTRERKPNIDKENIITLFTHFMLENDNFSLINVENKSKLITFTYNNKKYKIDLIETRVKKQENE